MAFFFNDVIPAKAEIPELKKSFIEIFKYLDPRFRGDDKKRT